MSPLHFSFVSSACPECAVPGVIFGVTSGSNLGTRISPPHCSLGEECLLAS